jgi:hypothetical protein
MKKYTLFVSIMLALGYVSISQPVIDQNDMPNVGDTIRIAIKSNLSGTAYTATGEDYTWDFSTAVGTTERVDTFVSVISTPFVYYPDFYNFLDPAHMATIAQPQADMTQLPNVQFTNVYNYYKETSSTFAQVGLGATVNLLPMPIKYDNPDVLYTFPLTYGAKDSCNYTYNINIPTMGYYAQSRKRINLVDGWGTVITPFDTFPAVRMLSTSYIHDTIHMDSLGIGFAQNRTEYEYKWLADTMGLPVLKVLKTTGYMSSTSLEYIKKYQASGAGINNHEAFAGFITVYPNPVTSNSQLYFSLNNACPVSCQITDLSGRRVVSIPETVYQGGFHAIPLDISGLRAGLYLLNLRAGNKNNTLKFSVQ